MGIEVKYDGNVIANISVGKTVELKCIDKKMLSDIVISYKTNDVEEETPSYPTDLAHYTVTVPAGWTAPSNSNGYYNVEGTISYGSVTNAAIASFGIGYNVGYEGAEENCISYNNPLSPGNIVTQFVSFTITFSSGSSLTDTNLIQWFVNNGATFTYNHSGGA